MAGRFRSKVEHTKSLIQSILFKMDNSGYPMKQNIREGLKWLREDVWRTSVVVPDGQLDYSLAYEGNNHPVLDWLDLEIAEVWKLYRLNEKSKHVDISDVLLVLNLFLGHNYATFRTAPLLTAASTSSHCSSKVS
jgi:hypothetical protein